MAQAVDAGTSSRVLTPLCAATWRCGGSGARESRDLPRGAALGKAVGEHRGAVDPPHVGPLRSSSSEAEACCCGPGDTRMGLALNASDRGQREMLRLHSVGRGEEARVALTSAPACRSDQAVVGASGTCWRSGGSVCGRTRWVGSGKRAFCPLASVSMSQPSEVGAAFDPQRCGEG